MNTGIIRLAFPNCAWISDENGRLPRRLQKVPFVARSLLTTAYSLQSHLPLSHAFLSHRFPPAGAYHVRFRAVLSQVDSDPTGGACCLRPATCRRSPGYLRSTLRNGGPVCGR